MTTVRAPGGRRGYALMLALVALVVSLTAAALIVAGLRARGAELRQATRALHLRALSDAGLALALDGLAAGGVWAGGEATPLDGGTMRVDVEPTAQPGWVRVTVDARWRGGRRVVEARVRRGSPVYVTSWRALPAAEWPAGR